MSSYSYSDKWPGPRIEESKTYKTTKGYQAKVFAISPGTWNPDVYGRYFATLTVEHPSFGSAHTYYWVEGPKAGIAVYDDKGEIYGNLILIPERKSHVQLSLL